MQCARIVEAFKPLEVTSLPIPELPDEGLLLKTLFAGICHSDIHMIDDETDIGDGKVFKMRDILGDEYRGIVPGHEICGQVIAVGSKVPSSCHIKPGDKVIVYPWRGCQACESCSMGYGNICENNPAGIEDIGQGRHGGGYSTHVVVPQWDLAVKLPKNIPSEIGCMLPCCVLASYQALLKARPTLDLAIRMRGNANLLIVGAGGLGFWAIVLVKSLLCDKNVSIIVADVNPDKLTEVSNFGADDAVLWDKDADVETLVKNTTMSGYNKMDAVLDFVGLPRTCQTALQCLHHGGTLVTVGLHGGVLPLTIPFIITRSLSVQGVRLAPKQLLKDLVDLFAVQDIDTLPPLEYYQLDEINTALDKLRAGHIKARALLKFTA